MIIIAIGEAFVAIGIGAHDASDRGEVAAAVLGLLVATSFWLAYFDFFSIRAARMLAERQGPERAALSRAVRVHAPADDLGIVLFAFSMKVIVGHVGDELDSAPAFALCGGSALYLLAYSAIRSRIEWRLSLSRGRFAAAVLLLLCSRSRPGAGARRAGSLDRDLARAARVRGRLVARGSYGVSLNARLLLGD